MATKLPFSEIVAAESGYDKVYATAVHLLSGTRVETLLVDMHGDLSLVRHWDCHPDHPERGSSGVEGFKDVDEAVEAFRAALAENDAQGHRAHPGFVIGWVDRKTDRLWWIERTGDQTRLVQDSARATVVADTRDLVDLMKKAAMDIPEVAAADPDDLRAAQCLVTVDSRPALSTGVPPDGWSFALQHRDGEHFVGQVARTTTANWAQHFDSLSNANSTRQLLDEDTRVVSMSRVMDGDRRELTIGSAAAFAERAKEVRAELSDRDAAPTLS